MVKVYRKDLGFGQGTDGQNYYEVSEERAKELASRFWPGALTIVSKIKNKFISS